MLRKSFSGTIRSLCLLSPVCLAAVTFGCKNKDKAAAWDEALDESNEGENTKDRDEDAGGEVAPTSTGKTQTPSAATGASHTATTTATGVTTSTASTATADTDSSDGGATSDPDEQSDDETENSEDDMETTSTVDVDAGGEGTGTGEVTSNDGCEYLICESFEGTEEGSIPEGWEQRGEEVAVSSEYALGGQHSLKLGAVSSGERRLARDASVLGGAHWGRIFLRLDVPPPDALVHLTFVALSGVGPANGPSEFRVIDTLKQGVDIPDVGSRHNWMYNVQPEQGEEFACGTGFDWEFDGEWHCAEYFVDPEAQMYRFLYDGEEQSISCDLLDLPDQFEELRVGLNNYQEAPPGFVAYIDDVAFDDEQIGCD
jgi:hypothetical protein